MFTSVRREGAQAYLSLVLALHGRLVPFAQAPAVLALSLFLGPVLFYLLCKHWWHRRGIGAPTASVVAPR